MRYLLLAAIRIYWLIPKSKRRTCLFKKSCSHFVFEAVANHGTVAGLKALHYRFKTCRYGAIVYINPSSGKAEMILANKDIITHDKISDRLLVNCQHPYQ